MHLALVLTATAALALFAGAVFLPGWGARSLCALLGGLLAGAGWLVHRCYTISGTCEIPVSDDHRLLPEEVPAQRSKRRASAPEQQRCLSEIRSRTRRLIDAANREGAADERGADPGAPPSVRPVDRARQALFESVGSALANGLDDDTIRARGFEQAVANATAISDLAYAVIGQVRSRLHLPAMHS